MSDPANSIIGGECAKCGHVWVIAYLPMDMKAVGKLSARAACPKCGDDKPLVAKTEKVRAMLAASLPRNQECEV